MENAGPQPRAKAIEDGYLVDVSRAAADAGFFYKVAMSRDAYLTCVQWTEEDSARQLHQDESQRLWDVLHKAKLIARLGGAVISYELLIVPRGTRSTTAVRTTLKMKLGAGDNDEFVVTIMLPHED